VSSYAVVHVDEIPELDDGRRPIRPLRHHLGITGFGVNAWTAGNAGELIINEHQEADAGEDEQDRNEELYIVTQGRAVFELDGERRDAPAGTLVFVRPRVKRVAYAEEPGTTVVSVGATPGKPYDPVGWELWYPLRRLYEAGEYEQVVERLRAMIDSGARYGLLFYNLACCESVTGRSADALEHLRQSVEMSEQFREYAKNDSDLDAIRDEPAFKEIVGQASGS
jgi:hypothetical protein